MSTTPHSGTDREIQQELERAKSEASQLASSAAETAKRRGQEAADRIKDRAADSAEDFASALESTADDLENTESGEMISGYGRSMAELMRRFAGGLREHEIEEFAGQLASFARRNPASFLAGSVALGFGVSRFLKATSTRSLEEYGYDDEDDEYLLDDEDDFEFDETGTVTSADPRYASASDDEATASEYESSGYGSSSTSYGAGGGDNGAGAWPEDRGRERPGAASSGDHWSPAIPDDEPSRSASAPDAESSERTDRSDAPDTGTRSDEIRRNEP